jgi:hypothetical protein
MREDLTRIRTFVDALVRRERVLVFLGVAGRLAWLLAAIFAGLGVAALSRWDRSGSSALLVLFSGIGLWWATALPLLQGWSSAADRRRQARLTESHEPDLRGRLVTAVDRVDGPIGQESEAMLGLVARRASEHIARIPASSIHPAGRRIAHATAASLALFLVLCSGLLVPGGPRRVVTWWVSAVPSLGEVAGLLVDGEEADRARVGDLQLRYTYPPYTGLEPREVSNSTGAAGGPPGTLVEVRARAAHTVEAAGLVAYEERFDAAVSGDGREVEGRFTIGNEPGVYRLLLYRSGEPERSPDFSIEPEADLPPDVTVDSEDEVRVAVDELFELGWRARDDYGVRRASLRLDGRDVGPALFEADERRAEASGMERIRPRQLGLSAGDEVKLSVVAWDNDTWSGSKVGVSRSIRLVVLGAKGKDRRASERQQELVGLMVPILARYLTEPWPPGTRSGEIALWGEVVAARYTPFYEAVERLWQGMSQEGHDAQLVSGVVDSARELVRYTQVAFDPGSRRSAGSEALGVVAELRDEAVEQLEDAILSFHRMEANRALRELAEQAEMLERTAELMEQLLSETDPDAAELLARLDMLQRAMERLAEIASRLDSGGLDEFVNMRSDEVQGMMEAIREAIAEGRMEDAKELMKRLSEAIEQMAQGIQDTMKQQMSSGDESMAAAKELVDELERLEQEQRQLSEQVRKIRESADSSTAAKAKELWEEVIREVGLLNGEGSAYAADLEKAKRPFHEVQRAGSAAAETERLLEAVRAHDIQDSKETARGVAYAWDIAHQTLQASIRRGRPVVGPTLDDVLTLRDRAARVRELLDELEELAGSADPDVQRAVGELEEEQRQLQQQLQAAKREAERVASQFEVTPDDLEPALQEAGERMSDASDQLGEGRPLDAEGSQGVAAERIRAARESLENAMQQAAEQAAQLSEPSPGEGGEEQRDGKEQQRSFDMEIPSREEFRTPEEYRKALLEGMRGEVPEEYRALKKRYYEELVLQ